MSNGAVKLRMPVVPIGACTGGRFRIQGHKLRRSCRPWQNDSQFNELVDRIGRRHPVPVRVALKSRNQPRSYFSNLT